MKYAFTILLILITAVCTAQEDKKYKPLVKELNTMLKDATEFSWMYEPDFEIVQPYKINGNTLSVIIKGTANDTVVTHKYQAPLDDVYDFVRDVYYVLSFKTESVKVYELQADNWILISERDFFHLGKLEDGTGHDWSRRFRKLVNAVYPLANEFETLD